MRKILFIILSLSVLINSNAQVNSKIFKSNEAFRENTKLKPFLKCSLKKMPQFDVNELYEEDKRTKGMDIPFRFGKGFDVNYTLQDGTWEISDTGRIWSLEISSLGAFSLNFIFDELFLPEGTELYIYNTEGTMVYGPLTSAQNLSKGTFLTDLIMGNTSIIQIFEPKGIKNQTKLRIKKVVHGYRNMFSNLSGQGSSGVCNNDICCFPDWTDESFAVAMVLLSNGTEWCSGSLVNNTAQDLRSYFLTAFHCIDESRDEWLSADEIDNAQNWMFRFKYKKITCSGSYNYLTSTYNRANFRAAWNVSDFVLMELVNSPLLSYENYPCLGWDRSGNTPTSGTGIHHPSGDIMKISFDYDQLTETAYGSSVGQNYWRNQIDNGTFEPGSSGSPLLDQNKRVVGQLRGGYPYCGSSAIFWHGCIHRSWDGGGTNETRLSNWLDPCGTGALTTSTIRQPVAYGPNIVCSSGATYTLANIPPDCTVSWEKSDNLDWASGNTGSSCTFIPVGNGLGWVQAVIQTTCAQITSPRVDVWVGPPDNSQIMLDGQICYDMNSMIRAFGSMEFEQYVTRFNWYFGEWEGYVTGYGTETIAENNGAFLQVPYGAYPQVVQVWAENVCGVSYPPYSQEFTPDFCGYYMSLSPNPASDNVEVSIATESSKSTTASKNNVVDNTYTVRVLNAYGMQVYSSQKSGNKFNISTSNLNEGVYVVEVSDGKNVNRKQLVVKKN